MSGIVAIITATTMAVPLADFMIPPAKVDEPPSAKIAIDRGNEGRDGPREKLEQRPRNTKALCGSTTYLELPGRFPSLYLYSPGCNANSGARNYGSNSRASQILAVRSSLAGRCASRRG